ncbi:hypothetical protein GY45DRAFT_1411842, partial [Cubamyces sp. BRFM 1775]
DEGPDAPFPVCVCAPLLMVVLVYLSYSRRIPPLPRRVIEAATGCQSHPSSWNLALSYRQTFDTRQPRGGVRPYYAPVLRVNRAIPPSFLFPDLPEAFRRPIQAWRPKHASPRQERMPGFASSVAVVGLCTIPADTRHASLAPSACSFTESGIVAPLTRSHDAFSTLVLSPMPPQLPALKRSNAPPEAEPQATGSNARRNPTPERPHGRDLMETGFNGLLQTLRITKEVSSACPQLQLAVGALLVVLEAYKVGMVGWMKDAMRAPSLSGTDADKLQKYTEVNETINSLIMRIESLNEMLRNISPTGHDEPSPALKERLDAFANIALNLVSRKVLSMVDGAKALQSRAWFIKLLSAADYTEKVKSWVEELSWHVHSLVIPSSEER